MQTHTGTNTKTTQKIVYQIMHKDRLTAEVSSLGEAVIHDEQFMPYDLYLSDENDDFDMRINNINVFHHWCASRVLSLDRKFAKDIFNSIGVAQAVTDRDRAMISLSYHCVSLTDVYWVKTTEEEICFNDINLYDHTLNDAVVELTLKGRQLTVTNTELAPDLSTRGLFPKAWIRTADGFRLLKDGGEDAVEKEILASTICQCFDIPQVKYRKHVYQGQLVSESDIITTKDRSMVSKLSFDIYAANHDLDTIQICKELDPVTFYGMNILDYLIGNTDRHPENWGFLIDNDTNRWISLYPVMDFNQSFLSYDTLDGASCQPLFPAVVSQRDAAIDAVKHIGLRQIREVDMSLFGRFTQEAEMFEKRLAELRKAE